VDFSGQWESLYHEDGPERLPGPELGDYLGLPINDAARLRGDSYDADRISVVQSACRLHVARRIGDPTYPRVPWVTSTDFRKQADAAGGIPPRAQRVSFQNRVLPQTTEARERNNLCDLCALCGSSSWK
jgi:hypothetical protein